MGQCISHADRETRFMCMKHQLHMCEACLQCRDPAIYCKHRPSCPIWFLHKQKDKEDTHVHDTRVEKIVS